MYFTLDKEKLISDFKKVTKYSYSHESADKFFLNLGAVPLEFVLNILSDSEKSYNKIHKGTPFYNLALHSFQIEDFEKAVFYMDAALSEDKKNYPELTTPAKLFFTLNTENVNQAALDIVKNIRKHLDDLFEKINTKNNLTLTTDDFVKNILKKSIDNNPELRTVATSFLSYILEFDSRKKLLEIFSDENGTGEPFFLHLLKGVVIFENFIANSIYGKEVKVKNENKVVNLNEYLKDKKIYSKLDFDNKPEGYKNCDTFKKLIDIINSNSQDIDSILTAWKLRNLIAHSISWRKPTIEEYEILHNSILEAICRVLFGLYINAKSKT